MMDQVFEAAVRAKIAKLEQQLAECERERNDAIRASMNDMNQLATVTKERDELAAALMAMLTHMGMDEDEWNRVTFDQARAALAKLGADETGEVL